MNQDFKSRVPVRVSCAIIEKDHKVLAAQRSSLQSQAGLWEFPGGKIDPGETAQAALVRELKEELGIEVITEKQLSPVIHHYPSISIELIPFTCRIKSGQPFPHEHSQIIWLFPKELTTLIWAPADIPVLEEYLLQIQ